MKKIMRAQALIFTFVSGITVLSAQSAPTAPAVAFEVASVRQNVSGANRASYPVPGARFAATGVPLRDLIAWAFGMSPRFVLGGPDRVLRARFDIVATAAGNATRAQQRLMLKNLLGERFNLRIHTETRSTAIYALTVTQEGRLGPQLRPTVHNCLAYLEAQRQGNRMEEPRGVDNRPLCRTTVNPFQTGGFTSRSAGEVGTLIRSVIEAVVDRPVVDQTGLTGNFEWEVTYALPGTVLSSATSIYTALSEQLGLKLEPRNYPLEMLVIDSVEMPTPN